MAGCATDIGHKVDVLSENLLGTEISQIHARWNDSSRHREQLLVQQRCGRSIRQGEGNGGKKLSGVVTMGAIPVSASLGEKERSLQAKCVVVVEPAARQQPHAAESAISDIVLRKVHRCPGAPQHTISQNLVLAGAGSHRHVRDGHGAGLREPPKVVQGSPEIAGHRGAVGFHQPCYVWQRPGGDRRWNNKTIVVLGKRGQGRRITRFRRMGRLGKNSAGRKQARHGEQGGMKDPHGSTPKASTQPRGFRLPFNRRGWNAANAWCSRVVSAIPVKQLAPCLPNRSAMMI